MFVLEMPQTIVGVSECPICHRQDMVFYYDSQQDVVFACFECLPITGRMQQ